MNLDKSIDKDGYANIIKVAIVKDDDINLYDGLYGYMELLPNKVAITNECLFDIASLTKTITAIIVYRTLEHGLINLDEKITKYEPRFINFSDVTILDLLAHRVDIWTDGHLGHASNKNEFYDKLYNAYVKNRTRCYVDTNYIILSAILETIYEKSFSDIVSEEISKPLNLTSLTFRPTSKCASCNYEYRNNEVIDTFESNVPHDPKAKVAYDNNFEIGCAGIFINASDMFQILISLIDGKERLLKSNTIESMIKYDDIHDEIKEHLKNYGSIKNIDTQGIDDINELHKIVSDEDYIALRSYNYFGTRYKNPIDNENFFPKASSDMSIEFSGYTGPTFFIDFKEKVLILIMCNYLHNNKLNRIERRNYNLDIIDRIYSDIKKIL